MYRSLVLVLLYPPELQRRALPRLDVEPTKLIAGARYRDRKPCSGDRTRRNTFLMNLDDGTLPLRIVEGAFASRHHQRRRPVADQVRDRAGLGHETIDAEHERDALHRDELQRATTCSRAR